MSIIVHDNKRSKSKSGGLAAGIAIGVAMGAASVALKDKKNQETVRKTIKKMKDWAERTSGQVAESTESIMQDPRVDIEGMRREIKDPEV